MSEYNVELTELTDVKDADCIILAVGHDEFKELSLEEIDNLYKHDISNENKIMIDVKSTLNKEEFTRKGFSYWRL